MKKRKSRSKIINANSLDNSTDDHALNKGSVLSTDLVNGDGFVRITRRSGRKRELVDSGDIEGCIICKSIVEAKLVSRRPKTRRKIGAGFVEEQECGTVNIPNIDMDGKSLSLMALDFVFNKTAHLSLTEEQLIERISGKLPTMGEMLCIRHKELLITGMAVEKLILDLQAQLYEIKERIQEDLLIDSNLMVGTGQKVKAQDFADIENVDFDFCDIDPLPYYVSDKSDLENDECLHDTKIEDSQTDELDGKIKNNSNYEDEDYTCSSADFSIDEVDSDQEFELSERKKGKRKFRKNPTRSKKSRIDKGVKHDPRKRPKKKNWDQFIRCCGEQMENKDTESTFFCGVGACGSSFSTIRERTFHRNEVHGGAHLFHCTICGTGSRHKGTIYNHILKVHRSDRPFECSVCKKCFAIEIDLRRHLTQKHVPTITVLFDCSICKNGKKYIGQKSLSSHIRTFHEKGIPRKHLQCEYCGKNYSNLCAFKKHLNKTHLNNEQLSVCDVCGKKLSDDRSLKKHKLSQHLKSYQYKCEICGSGSLYKSHLVAHLKSAHPSIPDEEREVIISRTQKVVDNTKNAGLLAT